jgi:cytidine deaminase
MKYCTFLDLDESLQSLLRAARSVAERAYNAYSGYFVGCAIQCDDGKVYFGTFFENASGPVGVCAERVAIGSANTDGHRDFRMIAIVGGPSPDYSGEPIVPCGLCRQSLHEFAELNGKPIRIVCSDMALSNCLITDSSELLPAAFGRK